MFCQVFKVFDKDGDGVISVEEWLIGLSTILKDSLPDLIKCEFISVSILDLISLHCWQLNVKIDIHNTFVKLLFHVFNSSLSYDIHLIVVTNCSLFNL